MTKDMDLSLEMPSNALSSMIAINATSVGSPIYPGSSGIFMALGLKDLHQMDNTNDQGDLDNKFLGNYYFGRWGRIRGCGGLPRGVGTLCRPGKPILRLLFFRPKLLWGVPMEISHANSPWRLPIG